MTHDELRKLLNPNTAPPAPLQIAHECPGVQGEGPLPGGSQCGEQELEYHGEEQSPTLTTPPSSEITSLDTQETSVRGDFDRFWAEKGTPADFFAPPLLDELSLSSNFRHSGWAIIRKKVFDGLARTVQSSSRRSSFGSCGSYSWVEQHNEDPLKFRIRHNHCNDRLCTPCANQRSEILRNSLMQLIGDKPTSFITLTLCGKNEPLGELVDRLYKSFRALRLHPLWAENVIGGAAFLEIKHNAKSNRWHPHLHIIANAKFIDQGLLSTAWRSITGDSYIVDIRRVKNAAVTGHYVTKYASKPLNTSFCHDNALLDEAIKALKGRRLCLTFGEWYGTPLTDAEDDELELADGSNYHNFCPLEDLLTRAQSGERQAVLIIKTAGIEGIWRAMLTPRPPPTTMQ